MAVFSLVQHWDEGFYIDFYVKGALLGTDLILKALYKLNRNSIHVHIPK